MWTYATSNLIWLTDIVGKTLDADATGKAAALANRIAKALSNTDFYMTWRKRVTSEFVTSAPREVRGDDMQSERRQYGIDSQV